MCDAWTVQKQRQDKTIQLYIPLENGGVRYPGNKDRV